MLSIINKLTLQEQKHFLISPRQWKNLQGQSYFLLKKETF